MSSRQDDRTTQCKRTTRRLVTLIGVLAAGNFFSYLLFFILWQPSQFVEVRGTSSSIGFLPYVKDSMLSLSTIDSNIEWRQPYLHEDVLARQLGDLDSDTPFPIFRGDPDLYTYEVLRKFPHDPSAFTQGLLFRPPDTLFESTGAFGGPSTLREVDLVTGIVRKHVELPGIYFAEGLTYHDDKLLQIFWRNNTGIYYDPKTFKSLGTFQTPLSDGWGISVVDDSLVVSDSSTELHFIQPSTKDEGTLRLLHSKTIRDGNTKIRFANELETVKGEIWANVLERECVMRINSKTGEVVGWINLSGLSHNLDRGTLRPGVLNGIAYDAEGDRIFLTGKNWANLFQVRIIRENRTSLDTVRHICHPANSLPQYGYP